MHSILGRRRRQLLAAFAVIVATAVLPVIPASAGPGGSAAGTGNADVYIRDNDNPLDTGTVPSPGEHWHSPDIKVCSGPPTCVEQSPIAGSDTNIHVTLWNRGAVPVTGTLQLFYAHFGPGLSTSWRSDWLPIATLFGVTVPLSGKTFTIPWYDVPGPGHFCLVAVFDSTADPVGSDEPDIDDFTKDNNNVAWHNVNTVPLIPFIDANMAFTLTNPGPQPWRSSLVLTPVGWPFVGPGRMVVDLGQVLGERWRSTGQQGVGVRPVGPSQVEIVTNGQARIDGLLINPREQFKGTVTFNAKDTAPGDTFVERISQTDSQGIDKGGVEYRLTAN
jgi:hypothetical protein